MVRYSKSNSQTFRYARVLDHRDQVVDATERAVRVPTVRPDLVRLLQEHMEEGIDLTVAIPTGHGLMAEGDHQYETHIDRTRVLARVREHDRGPPLEEEIGYPGGDLQVMKEGARDIEEAVHGQEAIQYAQAGQDHPAVPLVRGRVHLTHPTRATHVVEAVLGRSVVPGGVIAGMIFGIADLGHLEIRFSFCCFDF